MLSFSYYKQIIKIEVINRGINLKQINDGDIDHIEDILKVEENLISVEEIEIIANDKKIW